MLKSNFIYVLALLCFLVCLPLIKSSLVNSLEYYGIAENQVKNINLEYPVEILKIYKFQGEAVYPGDTLIKLRRVDLETKRQNLEFDKLQNEKKILYDKQDFNSNLKLLENNLKDIKALYQLKFDDLNHKLQLQKELIVQVLSSSESTVSETTLLLKELKEKEKLEIAGVELKINNLKNEFKAIHEGNLIRRAKLENEITIVTKAEQNLDLKCTEAGVIGQLEFSQGDKIPAYTCLMKIYGTHPNIVTIYIGDNQLNSLQIGDSVEIQSMNTLDYTLKGCVNALGTRITTLPERLKKIPELRAWGREIQIKIPNENELLQGEKVIVRINDKI